ncbi:OmpA family protein [Flavobacterium aquidurense]|uniref:OmpA family protein n=1 Tax=Flavobacterium aquidurense TaxID=362413 RepID=UPI002866D3A5|nr:OmpA family protein [Flavobacterium aquidurense]MDR7372706.1 outer membrane protein OmpA-like peptidoglycan-associated protein/tetratricopeptide (TPR) repeat protein [Flavobacterium aquidurense]
MKTEIYKFRRNYFKNSAVIKLLFLLIFVCSMNAYSQKTKEIKGDKEFAQYAYIDAIKTYERIYEKGYKSQDMLEKLGDSYYFKADLDNAAKWYKELFSFTQDIAPEYYYRYAQSLKATQDYKKADEMITLFNKINGLDSRGELATTQKNYLDVIKKNSGRYQIQNAGINSKFSDYGSAFYKDKIIFASARDTGSVITKKHSWTGEGFTNLYSAEMDSEGKLSGVKNYGRMLNTKLHESTPVFTKDGNTVYFTRNNYLTKKGKDKEGTTLLKIYQAKLQDDKWTNIKELPFNSNEYSVAHPALSADNKTLYFASNMPGTLGASDIFKVKINDDGSFGTPVNLGKGINTEGRETFPMITAENELYFASDGHPGLGGLDIFVSKLDKNGNFGNVINVGEPLNGPKDDFAFLINEGTRTGFISSNRDGGQGNDDIYSFSEIKKIDYTCQQSLSGVVTDKENGLPLAKVRIILFDNLSTEINSTISDDNGNYSFAVECGKSYLVRAEKIEYNTNEKNIVIPGSTGKTDLPLILDPVRCKVTIGDDLGKCFGIKMIYFDLDKSNITKKAEFELAKILDVLNQYPSLEIDVRSHTDCRQTYAYNMKLSNRRAKSTIAWFIKKGINPKRLTGRGYGESQLVNDCGCEPTNVSTCTEEQHQANRRSEFIITKL